IRPLAHCHRSLRMAINACGSKHFREILSNGFSIWYLRYRCYSTLDMSEIGILGVKTWRQRKGITLQAIAASTKLSVRHLEAIEAGDFKRLPGGIYNTSYIRQYARAI